MASTKRTISEQILRRLNSGDRSVASKWHQLEIDAAVMQVINSLISPQFYDTLKTDGSEYEGFVVCTYDNIPVAAYRGKSKSVLPAVPVKLPRNEGIQRICKANDLLTNAFIPATDSEAEMLPSQRLIGDALGQVYYKSRGLDILYSQDLTAIIPAITSVTIQLVVADFSKFTEYDLLPIDANIEAIVIETVYNQFKNEPTVPQIVDPTSDTK